MRRAMMVAALLALACTRENPDVVRDAPVQAEGTNANPQAGTSQDTALNPTVPINRDSPTSRVPAAVESTAQGVQLLEYEIRMPEMLPPGEQTLAIVNAGKETHGLAIEGVDAKTPEIAAGASSSLVTKLAAGTYTVYCPVKGHRARGMERKVTVR